jgi:hypothetical protein
VQVLVVAIMPLATAVVWQSLGQPIYFLGRYEVMVLPLLIAVLSGGAALVLGGNRLTIVAAIWCLGLAALAWDYGSGTRRKYPEPAMVRVLPGVVRPSDRVVFTGLFRATGEYYLRRAGVTYQPASFPPDVAQHLGWYWDDDYDPTDPALAEAARRLCPSPGSRTWVIGSDMRTTFLLLDVLRSCSELTTPFKNLGRPMSSVFLATPTSGTP